MSSEESEAEDKETWEKEKVKRKGLASIAKVGSKETGKQEEERKMKEKRDAEYKKRLEEDLRKFGLDDRQIAIVFEKEKEAGEANPNRPTYTRMSRKYLSIETLREQSIDYILDKVKQSSSEITVC